MRAARRQRKAGRLNLLPAGGLCSVLEPHLIGGGKLADCVNLMLAKSPDGRGGWRLELTDRPGLVRVTAEPLPGPVVAVCVAAGRTYLATAEALYRLDETARPVSLGSVEAAPKITPFRGLVIASDGGFVKAADPADAYAFGILCDRDNWLWGELTAPAAGSYSLHAGGITAAGCRFTAPAWGPGRIPLERLTAMLAKSGEPVGNLRLAVYDADGQTLLASGELAAGDLPTEPLQAEAELVAAPGQAAVTPAGAVRHAVVEYAGGDAANCVRLAFGSAAGEGEAVTGGPGAWTADAAKTPLLALWPGLPPEADCAAAYYDRLYLGDGDKLHYSGFGDPRAWGARVSEGGQAGHFRLGRQGRINALAGWYGELFASLAGDKAVWRISGSTPGADGDLAGRALFEQEGDASGRAFTPVGDNLLFLDGQVLGLVGVNGFGDVRRWPKSDDVADLLAGDQSGAFACWDRPRDLWLLHLPGRPYSLALHILTGLWSKFAWAGITPTALEHWEGVTYLGGDDGHLYRLDPAAVGHDAGREFEVSAWGPELDAGEPGRDKHFRELVWRLSAKGGARGRLLFRIDGGAPLEEDLDSPMSGALTLGQLAGALLGDCTWPLTAQARAEGLGFLGAVGRTVQAGIRLDPAGGHLRLGAVNLDYALLGG